MSSKLDTFILDIVKCATIETILEKYVEQSMKGFVYERLWDLMIKFGFCDKFPKSKYVHMLGNVNNGKLEPMQSIQKYLKKNKVISSNSGGCSDITILNEKTNTYIFISCKYIKSNKSIDAYDVQNIIAMCNDSKETYEKYKIYILVRDKQKVLDKIKHANTSSLYITKHMDNILDISDLNNAFKLFKNDITKYKFNDYDEIYCNKKDKLQLRFHQKLLVTKTSKLIEEGNKQILWGCKCRSGKTFMVGGFITEQKVLNDIFNVLIITPAPTETIPQFTNDLFDKFIDFKNFTIHTIETGKELRHIRLAKNNIIVVSKQLLQKYIEETTIKELKNLKLDLIVFDENHFTGTTNLSKKIFASYATKTTVKLYLTATYNKPLKEWNIPTECQLYWDIEDEQWCKQKNIDGLVSKHGNLVKSIITDTKSADIFDMYQKYPNMCLLTNMFDSQRYEIIKNKIMDSKYGFSFEVLFSLNKNKIFNFSTEIKTVLRYISGSNKEDDFKNGDKSIMTRINNLCADSKSRKPMTQLWFLPCNNINDISINLKKLMKEDGILKKYHIMIVNSISDEITTSDIKLEIKKQERIATKHNKEGLIILAGNMLSLGITLENCDVVMLLNNTLSADKIMQQMYRCMTEAGDKHYGYVVDLNVSRVINTCINYNIHNKSLNLEDKITYLIKNHLINIDADYFINKDIDSQKLVEKIVGIWKDDPINNFRILLRNLDDNYEAFDNDTQKLINKSFISSVADKVITTIEVNDEDKQTLPSGKEIIKDTSDEEVVDEKKVKEIMVSFSKEVLPYVIPLACILTIKESKKDFMDMLDIVQKNPELLGIFNDQSLIWWNSRDVLKIIKKIIKENYDENSNVYNISIQFKMGLQSLIDKPKELLELINECLKPKQVEKQKFGEVFTPMKLINEMLDKLPAEVWTNKNYKWFDPAVGMGNFPIAVYLRLMNTLNKEIPNENKRKKHIIEKMLYMSELNKKNCYIVEQIFNIDKKYKLNLYNGDTLKMESKKVFGIDKFDIVMGNPPYNSGGIRSHTGNKLGDKNETIWPKFVEYSMKRLNNDGYLIFINPLSWLKKSHTCHDLLLKKHIIWMKLWDNSQSKKEINADIPISMYILHNNVNCDKSKTDVMTVLARRKINMSSSAYLNSNYTIPLAYHSVFNKLIKLIENNPKLNLDVKTKTSKSDGKQMKLPEKYEASDMYGIDTYRVKDGYFVKKILEEHPDIKKSKLIIANKASLDGTLIDDGKLGLTGNHKYYILGDNLEKLQELFNTRIGHIIAHYTKYGQDFLERDAFTYLPDVRQLTKKELPKITDEYLYKLLKLSDDEIQLIEKV